MRLPYEFDETLPRVYIDAETYSEAPLKKFKPFTGNNATCGADVYARHPSTEVLMWSYQDGDDGEPQLWDATDPETPDMPDDLRDMLMRCVHGEAYAVWWNGIGFDRRILRYKHGINIPVANCIDLMYLARLACLPSSLDGCCKALGIDEDKAKLATGKKLIQLFCRPYKSTRKGVVSWLRRDRNTHPDKWAEFCGYGLRDTVAMSAVWKKIPKLNWKGPRGDFERRVIIADAAINDRGVRIDLDLARRIRDMLANAKDELSEDSADEYGGNMASNEQFLAQLQALWPSRLIQQSGKGAAAKGTLLEMLRDPDIPDAAAELIDVRMELVSKGGGKYDMIIAGTNDEGRYCDGFSYGQASRSLRWTGSRAGYMNMARGHHKKDQLKRARRMLKRGLPVELLFNTNKLAASLTRNCLLPDAGEVLHVTDFSNIEGRLAFFLAGGIDGVQKFINADHGGDGVYELAAAGMFGIPVAEVDADKRMIGKLVSLSSQYQAAHKGFVQFAKGYNFDVKDMCERLAGTMPADYWSKSASAYEFNAQMKRGTEGLSKRDWRIVHCLIHMWRDNAENECGLVTLWGQLETAAIAAVRNPGMKYWAGQRVRADGKKAFSFIVPTRKATGKPMPWLYMELPSGRVVMFAKPILKRSKKIDDEEGESTGKVQVWFMGTDEDTGQWKLESLYGGKLMAIGTQGTAREFQAEAIVRVHEAGVKIVIHVHDEIAGSAPRGDNVVHDKMCVVPSWFDQRFPLTGSAEIFEEYTK